MGIGAGDISLLLERDSHTRLGKVALFKRPYVTSCSSYVSVFEILPFHLHTYASVLVQFFGLVMTVTLIAHSHIQRLNSVSALCGNVQDIGLRTIQNSWNCPYGYLTSLNVW